MIKTMPEQKDTDFTWAGFKETNDSELVGTLANSINRVVTLINKYYNGEVPAFNDTIDAHSVCKSTQNCVEAIEKGIKTYSFREALSEMLQISKIIDGTLQTHEPWKLYKNDPENALIKDVLYVCLQSVAVLSVVSQPFLPKVSEKLRHILNLPALENGDWTILIEKLANNQPIIPTGHKINAPEHLFVRIDESLIKFQVEKLAATKENQKEEAAKTIEITEIATASAPEAVAEKPAKQAITFDDFGKLNLRTGVILTAEKVKKADKLLKLTVDLGSEIRTVVSGIALHYAPENIIGQQVVLLANLAPRVMRGIESNGMILMAENADGKLVFVSASEAGFGGGWEVR
jgi:methionyl-tRNA synthetase